MRFGDLRYGDAFVWNHETFKKEQRANPHASWARKYNGIYILDDDTEVKPFVSFKRLKE